MQSELQFDDLLESAATESVGVKSFARTKFRETNRVRPEDQSVHEWYRFVLSFPPHLVRDYLKKLDVTPSSCVLDPFCGTGTTLVECKKLGIRSIGIEANRMAWFASDVKVDWSAPARDLREHAKQIANQAHQEFASQGIQDAVGPLLSTKLPPLKALPPDLKKLLLHDSISPVPLHKTLTLLELIEKEKDERFYGYERLALARAIVFGISNLHFGPEVGVRSPKRDAPAISIWMNVIERVCRDLETVKSLTLAAATVHCGDAREIGSLIPDCSIDAVITSPPYPNEKDYTRTTRLESVLLGFIRTKQDLRDLKQDLVRSNTRSVYKSDTDDHLVAQNEEIQLIATKIEQRRIELGKTSGFERLYARLTKLYFGGMARHLAGLRAKLRPGAHLAYVVGDQASYLQVMIRTGKLIAEIALSLGYEVIGIDLFRTRPATATKNELREEVVLLRWPG